MKRVILEGEGVDEPKGTVHAVHIFDDNFTFCSLAIFDDFVDGVETDKKITCPKCITWIDYCKTFKSTDINRKFMRK